MVGMRVLVTGAGGFLGSWLVEALVKEGHAVTALVRADSDTSFLEERLQGGPKAGQREGQCRVVNGDLTDKASLRPAFEGAETVFHLGAVMTLKASERPLLQSVNVGGTRNVVELCEELRIPKLVHVSSVVTIGASFTPEEILNETSPNPTAACKIPNFESKREAEQIVLEAYRRGAIRAVVVNPSLIYGAGDARKSVRQGVVRAARGKLPAYTSGGVNIVAIEDVVQGILSAWKRGREGERYILAGENLTIRELFTEIARAAGVPPPRRRIPRWLLLFMGRAADFLRFDGALSYENALTAVLFHWFNAEKARRELGFTARPAREAIANSVAWMRQHGYLKD